MSESEFIFCALPFIVPTVALAIVVAPMLAFDAVRLFVVWLHGLILRAWLRRAPPSPPVEPVRLRGLSASAESSAAAPAGWIRP